MDFTFFPLNITIATIATTASTTTTMITIGTDTPTAMIVEDWSSADGGGYVGGVDVVVGVTDIDCPGIANRALSVNEKTPVSTDVI